MTKRIILSHSSVRRDYYIQDLYSLKRRHDTSIRIPIINISWAGDRLSFLRESL